MILGFLFRNPSNQNKAVIKINKELLRYYEAKLDGEIDC